MSLLLACAFVGAMLLSAAAAVFLDRALSNRQRARLPELPEFRPRHHPPRAITRITKDDLQWEIN